MNAPIAGSCLCGGVRYELRGPFLRAGHCHCGRCRKHSGAAAGTQGRVRREDFVLLAGAELVRSYRPGNGAVKAFCVTCGSSLFGGTWPDGPEVTIRLGSVDGDPGIRLLGRDPRCPPAIRGRVAVLAVAVRAVSIHIVSVELKDGPA
jgi:hypothetical protein